MIILGITPSYKALGVAVWLEACNHPAGCSRVIMKDKLWILNAIATHNTKDTRSNIHGER